MKPLSQTCSYGAAALLKQLKALQAEAPGVRQAEDIEYIHRMRVASRRLRASLPLFLDCLPRKKTRLWLKRIKKITAALGAARDADVQLDLLKRMDDSTSEERLHPGLRRLALRIWQDRTRLQLDVDAALDQLDQTNFYTDMEASLLALQPVPPPAGAPYPHELFLRSAKAISRELDQFLSFEPYVSQPERVTELHAMRIAAKRLRYTLEIFAPLYPAELAPYLQVVKSCQELLGDLHDCDVWTVLLPRFIEEERARVIAFYGHINPFRPLVPGLAYFQENRAMQRAKTYQEFRVSWDRWQTADIWAQLRTALLTPVHQAVFPVAAERQPDEALGG